MAKKISLPLKKWPHFKGELPTYQTTGASGFDVRAQLESEIILKPGARTLIPTGLSFEIPEGYEIQVRPRSGWAINKGITVCNAPGTIDADYRGEVKVGLINLGQETMTIQDQDRIAQLVLCPVITAEFIEIHELSESVRAEGGFGSTGY
ncbi:MAG: dUTP diphosphatase [Bdellovibrionales bacterium]